MLSSNTDDRRAAWRRVGRLLLPWLVLGLAGLLGMAAVAMAAETAAGGQPSTHRP